MSNPLGDMMTVTEAAKHIGMSDRRVRQLLEEGEKTGVWVIRGTRLTSRMWLVNKKSVESFARKTPPKIGRPRKTSVQA